MTLEIGYYGEEMHLKIKQGASFGPFTATMMNPDGVTPVNLTGCTFTGDIRKKAKDTTIVQVIHFSITDAINGKYQFWITDEETALIPCGETAESGASNYVYDIKMADSGGNVTPLYYGTATVFREVSHP